MIFEYTRWRAACDRCGDAPEGLSDFDTREGLQHVLRYRSAWVETPDGELFCPECAEEILSEVEVVE
jgi:hypothetical protein